MIALGLLTCSILAAEPTADFLSACPRLTVSIGTSRSFGTGVVIGRKEKVAYLLTAAHVVGEATATDIAVEFFTASKVTRKAVVTGFVKRNVTADLALLTLEDTGEAVRALPLAAVGARPKKFPFDAVSVGCSEGSQPTRRDESLVGKQLGRKSATEVAFFWQTASPPVGGRSGGPLVTPEGRVIGICAAEADGKGYYSHTDEIHAWLKSIEFGWLIDRETGKK